MSTDMDYGTLWRPLKNLCKSSYPVLESIMSSLTATDVSVFLYTFSLADLVPDKTKEKYMNIYRDLPGYEDWIDTLRARGDTFIIVGNEINMLLKRYKDPMNYWVSDDYRDQHIVWGIVVSGISYAVMTGTEYEFPDGFDLMKCQTYGLRESGEVGLPNEGLHNGGHSCEGTICDSMLPITNVTFPGPGLWPKCIREISEGWSSDGWHSEDRASTPVDVGPLGIYFLDWIHGTSIDVDMHRFMQPLDVMGMIGDRYSLTYINMNNSMLRHSLATWDYPEADNEYIDENGHLTLSIGKSEVQRSIQVYYWPRDVCSDSCAFKILFE